MYTITLEKKAETQYELNASDNLRQLDSDKNFYERMRLNLFTKIFKGNIVIKKTPAKKHIDIRVTVEFYAKLSKDAERCKMPLSDYCRDHLKGKTPKAALSDDEQKIRVKFGVLLSLIQL